MDNPKDIEKLIEAYIEENFDPNAPEEPSTGAPISGVVAAAVSPLVLFHSIGAIMHFDPDKIDFRRRFNEKKQETFSEMLMRLVRESGEKNSVIYNRANIDR